MEEKLKFVRKRDGRTVGFDKTKIADAIFKAAQSVGGQDKYLAEDLTEAVVMYLETQYEEDSCPHVEEIQDIVERVLIKTGHARTAKAYILYREQRSQIRKVREGVSPEEVLSEQQEISLKDLNLSVRDSHESMAHWNRQKITEALVKETGISNNVADIIARDVEDIVASSKISNPTSSLIRELVNAKLVKYGFEEERKKHSRLGLPVYDAKRIILSDKGNPEEVSLRLGQHVKKEFAVNDVFSQEVTDAHVEGNIHLHNLEGIDKFHHLILIPPETTSCQDNTLQFSSDKSKYIEPGFHLLQKAGKYVNTGIHLEKIDSFFGIARQQEDSDSIVRSQLQELFEKIAFCRNVSASIRLKPSNISGTIINTAAQIGAKQGIPMFFHVNPTDLEKNSEFKQSVSKLAENINIYFISDSALQTIGGFYSLPINNGQEQERTITGYPFAHKVSVNLPRIAYLSGKNQDGLFSAVDATLDTVMQSHFQKQEFMKHTHLPGNTTPNNTETALLEDRSVFWEQPVYLIGVAGLNEAAQYYAGTQVHESEEAYSFAVSLIGYMKEKCDEYSQKTQMKISLAQTRDKTVLGRFSQIDRINFAHYFQQALPRPENKNYTPDIFLLPEPVGTETLQKAGKLHSLIETGVLLSLNRTGDKSPADFISQACAYLPNTTVSFGK